MARPADQLPFSAIADIGVPSSRLLPTISNWSGLYLSRNVIGTPMTPVVVHRNIADASRPRCRRSSRSAGSLGVVRLVEDQVLVALWMSRLVNQPSCSRTPQACPVSRQRAPRSCTGCRSGTTKPHVSLTPRLTPSHSLFVLISGKDLLVGDRVCSRRSGTSCRTRQAARVLAKQRERRVGHHDVCLLEQLDASALRKSPSPLSGSMPISSGSGTLLPFLSPSYSR